MNQSPPRLLLSVLGSTYYALFGNPWDVALLIGSTFLQSRSAIFSKWNDIPFLAYVALGLTGGSLLWLSSARNPNAPVLVLRDRPSPAKVLLLPCKTTHSRMFPKLHSFSHSYLVVGIPVGWSGCAGGLVSAGSGGRRGWFHVDAEDSLERGNGHLGLRGKLDAYLESQVGTAPLPKPMDCWPSIKLTIGGLLNRESMPKSIRTRTSSQRQKS